MLVAGVLPASAILYNYDNFDADNLTCRLASWGGTQPTSGKLKLPSTCTVDGVTYTVTAIANHALDHLTTVTQIEIPASIVQIGYSETDMWARSVENFLDCPMLEKFIVESTNKKYAATGAGILVSKDATILYRLPPAISFTDGKFSMSSSVTRVPTKALSGNTTVKTMVLSKNMIELDELSGLCEMSALRDISISGNSDFKTVDGVLYADDNILLVYPPAKTGTSFTIPSTTVEIEKFAFANNRNLTSVTLPSSLKKIGVSAFARARKLSSIKIPATVETIGDSAFMRCPKLAKITFGGKLKIPNHFAYKCESLAEVDGAVPSSVSWRAFAHCKSLVSFPFSGATDFGGDSIFAGCGFTQVVFNSDEIGERSDIGWRSFADCANLTKIDYSAVQCSNPSYAYSMGSALANNCPLLTEVIVPWRTTFSSTTAGYGPTFGENSAVTKIVTGVFWCVPGSELIVYSGSTTRTPEVYTAVKGRIEGGQYKATTDFSMMFSRKRGAPVKPSIYIDLYTPYFDSECKNGSYVYPGATYYVPGLAKNQYKDASDAGCVVKEMFDFSVYEAYGMACARCVSAMENVVITGVSINGGTPMPVGTDGVVRLYCSVSAIKSVEVSFKASDVEMMTVYPADIVKSSGVEEIESADIDDASPLYYNLQGVEIASPQAGNVYIVRRGARVTKELYR